MSRKPGLLDGECGQPNALMRVGRQLVQDASSETVRNFLSPLHRSAAAHGDDEFSSEYLQQFGGTRQAAPDTFSMHGLLNEANRMETPPSVDWTNEYLRSESVVAKPEVFGGPVGRIYGFAADRELKWSAEYLTDAENALTAASSSTNGAMVEFQAVHDAQDSASWANEFEASRVDPAKAHEWDSEFKQFTERMGQAHLNDQSARSDAEQRSAEEENLIQNAASSWQNLQTEWDSMNSDGSGWLAEYADFSKIYKDYHMAEENPYLHSDDALAQGKRYLADGDLSNAVLCFEAAVQHQPESAESWLYLSRAQSENEQEPRVIAAANKCLDLDPHNVDALQILATAYANESLTDLSCKTLARWLAAHPKYKGFAPVNTIDTKSGYLFSSFMDQGVFNDVEAAFLNATRSTSSVDPDLQNVLGILYNLNGNVERAVDCFQTAIMVKPDDPRLWNRLGATLANGGRSAEAIAAYRKALQAYPGFVRARYNLGISCLNLNANKEAVEHLLSALSLQTRGVGPSSDTGVVSNHIWTTLRVVVSYLNRDDLLSMVDARDLDKLKAAFNSPGVAFSG